MSEYPYLAALLPMLSFGETEFPSSERFLEEAGKWLGEEEFDVLSGTGIGDYTSTDHPLELVAEYCRFERRIRSDIAAYVESRRAGREHKTNAFPTSYLKDTTPLEAEQRLLRLRWDYIAAELNTHHADLHALIVYRLKVQILERLAAFDPERGGDHFRELTDVASIPRQQRAD
ncbi:MAG: DUF2764 family protein [Lentisphaerae bacterium]|jgi:hypothetical protein|nr:DUF2764 family protein [Lentisphaerota bacterium]MBT4821011.1 DUF2764 family protein [Lentisphaerota bacterium]MBT5607865.1 DUF2764 family protein [Lentisphaerota bacterium]MBT7054847.1 DUF2764 family protein [Lentisphaerota bacterium]MBT7845587.1 DUF2764 family protein [Lentisphaerota bacterium]